jgi:hypothetical protein
MQRHVRAGFEAFSTRRGQCATPSPPTEISAPAAWTGRDIRETFFGAGDSLLIGPEPEVPPSRIGASVGRAAAVRLPEVRRLRPATRYESLAPDGPSP